MLVLSRKPGESIKLGDEIEVVIVAVEGQRVRIGIKAPREVRILRTEIDPKIIQSNQDAVLKPNVLPADLLRQAAEARARKDGEGK
ncbi:carbon storage regulator, CsrA [Verrucomicrobium sp. GAS474]|uniref:carbon storage regulator CsrA n=1 Tax=Verrucomicrobium sp. GAS474 TaxID=1882831 RepID=UPI0008797E9F|nr:carbon storage regulator CsrA [Verrucomicrobium sp. GAS474]SDU24533.1 carbon storage regulator, CsrA [Verrucomicrobium sp. GAS474]